MSIHSQAEELLRQCEKLLREADEEVARSTKTKGSTMLRRRNAINAACNALYRATRA